jgi:type III pantothenate kinase
MVEVLAGKTAGVTHGEGSYTPFPTLSEDAVYSGAIMSLCGAIRQMHAEMIAHGQMQPLCVLSGGDASMLFPGLTAPFEHVENLVLEGLIRIAQEGPDP